MQWDAWACALSGYCERKFLFTQCSTASSFAWPILFLRFSHCNQFVDPSNPQNESRSSLLRSSKSKSSSFVLCGEMLSQENYLSLWQKYLVVTFALCHSNSNLLPNSLNQFRSMSPCFTMDSSEVNRSLISSVKLTRASTNFVHLLQKATTIIRWEATDVRDSVALGIGSINPECFEFLLEEFNSKGILRELSERKNENNVRRRRRKDLLRLQILRIIEFTVFRGLFEHCAILERNSGTLPQSMLELFDSIRFHTENDNDRDLLVLTSLRLHFAKLISLIVTNTPIEQREKLLPPDSKRSLFFLFLSWCGRTIGTMEKRKGVDVGIYVEQQAIRAMCALTSLGPMFECSNRICDEDSMFRWLETLLSSANPTVDEICEQTLCLMLHLNEHHPRLLERVVQMCYTKNDLVGIRCFRAISMLFSQREFPCEYISLLCLCQSFASSIELASVRQTAFLLVQLLRHQFLNNTFSPTSLTPIKEISSNSANGQPEISFPSNQLAISKYLSSQYPQLTMPIFSEICCRLESARPNRQLSLLTILPEWLRNVHLVDPNCDIVSEMSEETDDDFDNSLGGDAEQSVALNGWGSEESTQLILNNLLYLTAKLANEYNSEVENIWQCVATSWPSNLAIIVHYLFVMLSLSLDNMLALAKRICVYLLNATGDRLVSLLMGQLQRVGDPFMAQLCRSEIPPFFRWQSNFLMPKDGAVDEAEKSALDGTANYQNSDKNVVANTPTAALMSGNRLQQQQNRVPNQLPMPPYGGNYCRLSTFLPSLAQNVSTLSRNNLALFLLCDLLLVGPGNGVDWSAYHPKLLHMATINLDAHRTIVCVHARQILLNLCLYFTSNGCSVTQMATAILKHCHSSNCNGQIIIGEQQHNSANNAMTTPTRPNNAKKLNLDEESRIFPDVPMVFASKKEVLTALVQLFSSDQQKSLWEHEEVTQLCWKPDSVKKLECLVHLLVAYLHSSISDLVLKWTHFAIDFAISSNNRHLAGRSFQTASALGLSPTPFLHQILSRLTEVVGDNSEESQSYITDLFMCLQSLAQNMANASHPTNASQFQSPSILSGHSRSVSYTQQISTQQFISPPQKVAQKKSSDMRHSLLIGTELLSPTQSDARPLIRSQSATTLKLSEDNANVLLTEKESETISQLLFIGVAMMESSLDNEYFLGLSFVDKLLLISGKERLHCLRKLDEFVVLHGWDDFPGIVTLCLKGALYSSGSEWAISVFCNCIPQLNERVVVSKQPNDAFALMVIASLPQFVLNFDAPTQLCSNLAQKISLYCQTRITADGLDVSSGDHPICNLVTIMNQFRARTFPRERAQWTKCVVNYLIDAFEPDPLQLILFLAEMLEKCSATFHATLLDTLYLLFAYGNYNDSSPVLINAQVIRVVFKNIHGPNGREASKILKIVTDQWNSIAYNSSTENEKSVTALRKPEFELHFERIPFAKEGGEGGVAYEKALKNKVRDKLIRVLSASGHRARSPKHSSMLFSQSSSDIHQKVREATAITSTCQSGGVLPASEAAGEAAHLSSTWSQQQPLDELIGVGVPGVGIDRMSSPNSLMSAAVGVTTNSGANSGGELASLRTTDSFPRVFKEFDFLEAEHDSVSESTESCFNWMSTMRTPRCGVCREDGDDGQDGANLDEDVPDEDDFYNDEEEDEMDQNMFTANRVCIGNFGSTRNGTGSRHSMGSSNNSCRNGTVTGGERKGGLMGAGGVIKKRPQSRTSDSNDISSDRTPIQSSRHSDEEEEDEDYEAEDGSMPSCPLSENEESVEEGANNLSSHNKRDGRTISRIDASEHLGQENALPISPTNMTTAFARSPSTATSNTHRHNRQFHQLQKRHKKTNPSTLQHLRSHKSTSAADSTTSAASLYQRHNPLERNNAETCSSSALNFRTISLSTPERMSTAAGCSTLLLQQRLHSAADVQQHRHEFVEQTVSFEVDESGSDMVMTPLECSHHISGSVEQIWNTLVTTLGNDQEGKITSSLMLLFTQLLRESVVHLSSIFRDAFHLLTSETSLLRMPSKGGISTQLSHSLNVVLRLADCPFLFATPSFIRSSNLLICLKLALFEIREHFDTYAERRSQAIRALNSVKSSLKLMIISNNGSAAAVEGNRTNSVVYNQQFDYCSQQTVLLCKSLHRLSFQLLLMLEKLLEMVQFVLQSTNSQDYDMTPAVISLQRDLLTHQAAFALDELCSADGSALSQSHSADSTIRSLSSLCAGVGGAFADLRQSRDTLVLHITNKQFKNAFNKLTALRSHYCNSASGQFGCCEQTNVDVLLLHFCRSHLSLRMWALVGPLEQLRCWCTQFKEANVQLGILVRNIMLAEQSTTNDGRQQQLMMEQNAEEDGGGRKKSSTDQNIY
uniref:Protein furry n=1 Tax=Globodera rostochiensis TaxID=31243 RepID=A0A914HBH7_GLORO